MSQHCESSLLGTFAFISKPFGSPSQFSFKRVNMYDSFNMSCRTNPDSADVMLYRRTKPGAKGKSVVMESKGRIKQHDQVSEPFDQHHSLLFKRNHLAFLEVV